MTKRTRRTRLERKVATGKQPATAAPRYRVWLVEQDLTGLFGEYLTEVMVLARSNEDARDAACSLAHAKSGFGLVVQRDRLRVIDYGPAPEPLPAVLARHRHREALVLVVGTGSDDGGPPAAHDYDEEL